MATNRYTDEDALAAALDSKSIAGYLKKLKLKVAGGNYTQAKKTLQRLGVDTSHWTGQGWSKDQQLKNWQDYNKVESLKPHLIKERGHKCEVCGLEEWGDQKIPLEVHHGEGGRTDNNPDNLSLLCCNCHAQTDNWRNKGGVAQLARGKRLKIATVRVRIPPSLL